ncbi:MAG: hypothetical protein RLZ39_1191 [Bacteroidota bacterium]|jgi:uncharacterized membrane protein HdeD (DUF308 family)
MLNLNIDFILYFSCIIAYVTSVAKGVYILLQFCTIKKLIKLFSMKKNMGILDRSIRVILAIVLMVLNFTDAVTGRTAIITISIAIVFLLTSLLQFCPLYLPFKISTRSKN